MPIVTFYTYRLYHSLDILSRNGTLKNPEVPYFTKVRSSVRALNRTSLTLAQPG